MADGNGLTKSPVSAGGKVMAIVPQSFDEAYRVAQVLAASGMTPKDINTPEKVMVAIMAGAEIGMAPFQALQSFAIINGRPKLWGDGMMGVVRARGVRVEESLLDGIATCTVTRPDSGEKITRTFSEADAVQAGLWKKQGPWTTYPQRMLQMRARAWALRDGCADMLGGIQMAEEAQDVEVIADEPIVEFIKGAAKDRIIGAWRVRLEQATTPEEIEAVNTEIREMSARLGDNAIDGIEAISVQQYERVCEGIAPGPLVPSPFEDLKAGALACIQMDDNAAAWAALIAWKASLTKEKLSRCDPDEKNELNRLFSNCKKELLGNDGRGD